MIIILIMEEIAIDEPQENHVQIDDLHPNLITQTTMGIDNPPREPNQVHYLQIYPKDATPVWPILQASNMTKTCIPGSNGTAGPTTAASAPPKNSTNRCTGMNFSNYSTGHIAQMESLYVQNAVNQSAIEAPMTAGNSFCISCTSIQGMRTQAVGERCRNGLNQD